MTSVVIVESPSKAKTINKYLGSDFQVLASYGHIRDLPSKDGSVRPNDDFEMDWEVDSRSKKQISDIEKAVKGADKLFLATDPDREGEAISWHVLEVLSRKKLLDGIDTKRVVFNEITKGAILEAFDHPRELNTELVDAYLARRALDYLVGFTLSPVLWRKLPGSRSAGRVQSVALRIICERELEIEVFKPQEYWSIETELALPSGETFKANLSQLDGEKLKKLSIASEDEAKRAVAAISAASLNVGTIERKQVRRNPSPPFTTSTVQQEAARKLYFGAKKTMQVAQRLYEGFNIDGETVGLITYMRTDGVSIAQEAVDAVRTHVGQTYGQEYVPDQQREYKNKAKNAQEAHEAIRPTDIMRTPKDVAPYLDEDQFKLYDLIWKRTVASQMASAVLDQVGVDIPASDNSVVLRATGSVISFYGFYKLYREGSDENGGNGGAAGSKDEKDRILPPLTEGTDVNPVNIDPEQHFTQPPPRYSEASLVKTLEELGIGRPSTYASILSVLQDRNYVRLDKRRFEPEDRGRLVTAFLSHYFPRYVEYDFTAELENELDEISAGKIQWKEVLRQFWAPFFTVTQDVTSRANREIIDAIDDSLGPHFFPEREDGRNTRKCPKCTDGRLGLKPSRQTGFFIGCANYPDCNYTRSLGIVTGDENEAEAADTGPRDLGTDPATGLPVSMRKGPFGPYIQLGETPEKTTGRKKSTEPKPKRASIPRTMSPAEIDMEKALKLLSLPREIGEHPETRDMIKAGLGRFGPYLLYQGNFISLKEDDVLEIGLNRAVTVIAEAPPKAPVVELGLHPDDDKPILQKSGRWGPFVQHGKVRATAPKGTEASSITLEIAIEMLAAKVASDPKAAKKKPAKKKTAAKKKPAAKKKAAPKKSVAKSSSAASE
jgi:DNA topoisomerase I